MKVVNQEKFEQGQVVRYTISARYLTSKLSGSPCQHERHVSERVDASASL